MFDVSLNPKTKDKNGKVLYQCCGFEIISDPYPDPTFQEISDPDPTQLLSKEAKVKFKTKLKHKF